MANRNWGKGIAITSVIAICVICAEIGHIWMENATNDKPIEVWALHEVAGRNEIEEQFEAEKGGYKKTINDLEWLKDEYYDENQKLTELVSRGNARKTKPILDYDKLSCPRYIVELMERMSAKHGFPSIATVYCIAEYESGFSPTCWTTKGEDSRGLLQVNVADPSHARRNPNKTKLFDPSYNLEYQLDELKIYYDKGLKLGLTGADLVCYVSRYGQRPKWKEWIADRIHKSYKEYQNAVIKE